ncbi:MAG: UDP-N-acetylmuramoyl-tripeptide--D-alanyl-D-alanine ligase, partial [Alphaproteobacteria bacterium]|nr:UDP-N-acetylmuramoyl-tripeptide--D-alanyl-D-alanine ligase [Alphaproteobacteria bacterium]
FDGHDYIEKAFEMGAAAALVSQVPSDAPKGAAFLIVENTEKALRDLGVFARARTDAKIIGITGSVGKTGVKECLSLILGSMGKCSATQGNLNNHLGLPLSLARMPANTDYGVFEMGMNHAGELIDLSKLARPHIAVITTVNSVHVEYFENEEAIAAAKAEIFEGMDSKGIAILNADNKHFEFLKNSAEDITVSSFGFQKVANCRISNIKLDGEGSDIEANIGGEKLSFRLNMPGEHWAINSLAVLGVINALGLGIQQAAEALSQARPGKGRGETHVVNLRSGHFTLVDESYNASPVSMEAAIANLGRMEPGEFSQRVAVLGDMLELGDDGPELHASLVNALEKAKIDKVYTAGHYMSHLRDALLPKMRGGHAPDSQSLAILVAGFIRDGDVVLVKGSAGSKTGLIVNHLLQLGVSENHTATGS